MSHSACWGSSLASLLLPGENLGKVAKRTDMKCFEDKCDCKANTYSVLWQNIKNNHFQWFKTGRQREESDHCIKNNAEAKKTYPVPHHISWNDAYTPLSPAVMWLYVDKRITAVSVGSLALLTSPKLLAIFPSNERSFETENYFKN